MSNSGNESEKDNKSRNRKNTKESDKRPSIKKTKSKATNKTNTTNKVTSDRLKPTTGATSSEAIKSQIRTSDKSPASTITRSTIKGASEQVPATQRRCLLLDAENDDLEEFKVESNGHQEEQAKLLTLNRDSWMDDDQHELDFSELYEKSKR